MRAWVGTTGISRRSCLIYAICRDASRDYRSACILPTENRFDSRNSPLSPSVSLFPFSPLSRSLAPLSYWRGTHEVRAIRLLLNPSSSNSYLSRKYATMLSGCHFFFFLPFLTFFNEHFFQGLGIRNR